MKNLYGSIKINKVLGKDNVCIEESINYYKLKNKKYGIEIVKENNIDEEKVEIANRIDITDNEEKIDKILKYLVIKEITPSSSDVIEDVLKIYA